MNVNFNTAWVRSFKSAEEFSKSPKVKHLIDGGLCTEDSLIEYYDTLNGSHKTLTEDDNKELQLGNSEDKSEESNTDSDSKEEGDNIGSPSKPDVQGPKKRRKLDA